MIYNNEKFNAMPIHKGYVSCWDLINNTFTLIEDQTIDIDNIEEIDTTKTFDYSMTDVFEWNNEMEEKINETIRAVKHLNKEIQSIKKIDGTDTNVGRKEK